MQGKWLTLVAVLWCLGAVCGPSPARAERAGKKSAQNIVLGGIQFPGGVLSVPSVSLYWCGRQIPDVACVKNDHMNRFTFTLQRDRNQKRFYVLVTEVVRCVPPSHAKGCSTTVDHLAVPEGYEDYKLYALSLEQDASSVGGDGKQEKKYSWRMQEELRLLDDRSIPDETLIVVWDPKTVSHFDGGSSTELPSLMLRSDLISYFGTEQKMQRYAVALQLRAIDLNTFHAPMEQKIKVVGNCVVRTPAAA